MGFLMAILAALMISDVPYPAFPQVGYKTTRQRVGSLVVLGGFAGLVYYKSEFIFPAMIAYVAFGLVKFFAIGLFGQSKSPEEIYWSAGGNGPVDLRDAGDSPSEEDRERFARRRRRRRSRNPKPGPPFPPSAEPRDPQGP
jgi:CDP-diacylglycerol--serine O-phosphatidyltransferase